ncbi:MAG: arylsulfatase [Phycisphaeraceae bacterium]|nr:arylsulfatase [Phycisphaeraceae bacterium]
MKANQYTRRDFLRFLGGSVATIPLAHTLNVYASPVGKPKRPNIVLIMSDDMGFSDIGCYGGSAHTPRLDDLAANGLRFTQFYNTARCCPTRASLLTGLYQHQAGVGHMTDNRGYDSYQGDLDTDCLTIAQVLKQADYRTYMAGKWHVTRFTGKDGPKHNWPLQRGFDKFYGTITGAGSFYDPTTLCRGNQYITPDNDPEYTPKQYYYTDAISDHAVQYVREHAEQPAGDPFFMYVAFTAAHWPMHALEEDIAPYHGQYDKGYAYYRKSRLARLKDMGIVSKDLAMSEQAGDWASVENKPWEARCMEVYAAMIDRMDQGIGKIVAELKKQGVFEDTLILFLQDNGGCAEGMGRGQKVNENWLKAIKDNTPMASDELQPNIWPPMKTRDGRPVRGGPGIMPGPADTYVAYGKNWANVSNTPFRLYKHWVHEGGISTPLIAHWPARIKSRGQLRNQPGHLIDIMATCVDVAGAVYPAAHQGQKITPMEGKSLMPAFDNKPIAREALYWEHEGNRAVRQGQWKAVSRFPDQWELYDIEADRSELNDLAARNPQKLEALKTLYQAWATRCNVQPWPVKKRNTQ